ncbi:MAG: flagellar basal body-associated FliL family protein [Candidatus Hydrogenedentota bacterium]
MPEEKDRKVEDKKIDEKKVDRAERLRDEEKKDEKKEKRFAKLSSPLVKVIILGIIFLTLLSVTTGVSVYMIKNITPTNWEQTGVETKNVEEQKVQIQEKKQEPLKTYRIEEPFKLVLYDKDGNTYSMSMKIAFGLKKDHVEDVLIELEARFSEIKDIILQTIYSQNPAELIYINGQISLKIEIKNKVNAILIRPIERVYFEDFVISK